MKSSRPTKHQIATAVTQMAFPGAIRYFPADVATHRMIMDILHRMVPSVDALNWLVSTMVHQVGEWTSLKDLRGVLCLNYDPLDGIRADFEGASRLIALAEESYQKRIAAETEDRLVEARKQLAAPDSPETEEELRRGIAALERKIAAAPIRRMRRSTDKDYEVPKYLQ